MPRRRTIGFGVLVAFFVAFWLLGQAATLRWQVRHLVTHTPEVIEDGASPQSSSSSQAGA